MNFYQNMFSDFIASYTTLFGALITTMAAIFVLKYWFDAKKTKEIAFKEAKKVAMATAKKKASIAAKVAAAKAAAEASKNTEEKIVQLTYAQLEFLSEMINLQKERKDVVRLSIKMIFSTVNMISFMLTPLTIGSYLDKIYDLLKKVHDQRFYGNYADLQLKINGLIELYNSLFLKKAEIDWELQTTLDSLMISIRNELSELMAEFHRADYPSLFN